MQKILIVEDDPDIAAIERDYLELNGCQVEIAADGEAGLALGLGGGFDLILLDLMLPGVDGFTVCRKLRERIDTPILMVTARREDVDKIRGLGLGADDYIEKPFSPSVLVARVKAHLARYERLTGGRKQTSEIHIGGLSLHTDTRRLYVESQEVELKNKEYELLLFFMLHVDIVFSREELYEKIWGLEAMGDNATVAVHINRLRGEDRAGPRQAPVHPDGLGCGIPVPGTVTRNNKIVMRELSVRQNSFYQSGAMLLTALLFIASLVPTRFAAGSVGEVNLHMGQSADTVYLTYTSSSRTAAPVRVPAGSAAYLAQSSCPTPPENTSTKRS